MSYVFEYAFCKNLPLFYLNRDLIQPSRENCRILALTTIQKYNEYFSIICHLYKFITKENNTICLFIFEHDVIFFNDEQFLNIAREPSVKSPSMFI